MVPLNVFHKIGQDGYTYRRAKAAKLKKSGVKTTN